MNLAEFNQIPAEDARAALLDCCGSASWAAAMVGHRPFRGEADLLKAANEIWWRLTEEDWLQAFARHPRIGAPDPHQRWSQQEQSGMQNAGDATRIAIAELDSAYAEKFGYICIICATGRSAEELLTILKDRIRNDPATEMRMAAEEQSKITTLRLRQLLSS